MEIYVVQEGDTIESIANRFEVSVNKLTQDNGIADQEHLVIGQSLVITYPKQIHIVREGDSLVKIANEYQVSFWQLIRNNPFLQNRESIYIGETLVISYHTSGKIATNGYAHPFIDKKTLRMTLPYLTYLTIFNYGILKEGKLDEFYDETEIVQLAKQYGVIPIMSVSSLSIQGKPNIRISFDLLLSEKYQEQLLNNILNMLKIKGYYGVNFSFLYQDISNQKLYEKFLYNMSIGLNEHGYQVFVTVNPNIENRKEEVVFEKLEYASMTEPAEVATFINYTWGASSEAPAPISSNRNMEVFIRYVGDSMPSDKIILGTPLIGYDWDIPFVAGVSKANSLSYKETIRLASGFNAVIQFDPVSKTPFFEYETDLSKHLVWFIDARSIDALLRLISQFNLNGTGVWNIMIYNEQLWSIINAQYEIEKVQIL